MLIKDAIDRAKQDAGVSSDDSSTGNRRVYMILKASRAELLRQEVEKKGTWKNIPMQTLRKFPMEQMDIAESDEFKAGEVIYKSRIELPDIMDTKEGKITGGIYLPTGERLALSSYSISANSQARRYRSLGAQVYMRDNHLYVRYYSEDVPRLYMDVDAIFENPEEVERINRESGGAEGCVFYPDLPFYLPGYLEGRFFRIVRSDIMAGLAIPKDNNNNGKEDLGVMQQNNQQNQPT